MNLLKAILCVATLTLSCSSYEESEDIEVRRKDPTEKPKPTEPNKKWDDIKTLVADTCGTCHNGVVHPKKFDTFALYKVAGVKNRISNDTMPPGGGLPQDTKDKLLSVW